MLTCFATACLVSNAAADDPRLTPLVKAVQLCQECVVNIHTEKNGVEEAESRFFTPKARRITGMGTGIVVDERGYIVTNYHVIHEVDQITVTLKNGDVLDARPVSFDRKQDMAIIHVKSATPLKVMDMGISSDVRLAEQVFAVGNAFGYEHTVTAGIVSALGRDVEVDETQSYENLIQTDASINPGNSGGPLLNVLGEVIGINVAIRAGAQRIGFAIPIDDARRTVARLLSTERLNGVFHGVFATDTKVGDQKCLVVDDIAPGSAAALCGLQQGDTVKAVRGVRINDNADWERALLDMPVGSVLDVEVLRNGQPVKLAFTVGVGKSTAVAQTPTAAAPVQTVSTTRSAPATSAVANPARQKARELLGIEITTLNGSERRLISPRYHGGMKIVSVTAGSRAERHGIRAGDILLGLDGFETLNDRNLTFILQDSRIRKLSTLSFQIFRQSDGALVGHMDLSN
ncbi:MAG: trypsin-like peptidase domain-containing protein [Fuerstiella sp.]